MSNRADDLHPAFRPIAALILQEGQQEISRLYSGSLVRLANTLRTIADQADAFAAKASRWKVSWHMYGLAFDFAVIEADGSYVEDGADPRYKIIADIGKKHGCIAGIDWHEPDFDHLEWHPGFTLQQYLDFFRAHPAPLDVVIA